MIHDITPPISDRLKVWPGDPTLQAIASDGKPPTALSCTLHIGAHADAPNHLGQSDVSIDACELEPYLGPCQVIRVEAKRGTALEPDAIKTPVIAQRVLFATGTYPDPTEFNEDFAGLSPALIQWLHDKGVLLVGIDTPSVDPYAATDLPAHKALFENGMANLEGLSLEDVTEGMYELIALPLKLVGFDGSPVRAILRTIP